jgi:hypothetical protein
MTMLSVYASVYQLLNNRTDLYGFWYVHHTT